jgi:hypothetical protein
MQKYLFQNGIKRRRERERQFSVSELAVTLCFRVGDVLGGRLHEP